MLYTEGTLIAEDRTLRRIARSRVDAALRTVEAKAPRVVDSLVNGLTSQDANSGIVEDMLKAVVGHPAMATEMTTIDRYLRAFPDLQPTVANARERIEDRIRVRLEHALGPLDFQRRFRFTRVRHCH
jgi:hypothetical protein